MQPQIDNSLPPVNLTPPAPPIPPELPPDDPQPKGPPKWLWVVLAGGIVFIGLLIFALVSFLASRGTTSQGGSGNAPGSTNAKLTVGSQPYVYPCSVATEADFARIFKLDNPNVGTIAETSALPLNDIDKNGADITKVAPTSDERYSTTCTYTLAKKEATSVSHIEVKVVQLLNEDKAAERYKVTKSTAAEDYTRDDIDNGKRQLTVLPSFPNNSFVQLPKADSSFPGLEASYLSGSRIVTLDYNFLKGETTDTILPLLDEYAKAVQLKLNDYKEGKPVDLTGRATFDSKKFVDVCYRSGLDSFSSAFDTIQFRPDEATVSSNYGSLQGSRAADDGVVSYCNFSFNTPGDRDAQEATNKDSSGRPITSAARWPHTFTITVNSLRSADEVKAFVAAKKARLSTPPVNGAVSTVEDIASLGTGAVKQHKETAQAGASGQAAKATYIDDVYVIADGNDVITIATKQVNEQSRYQTVPLKITQDQVKKVFESIHGTLEKNRQ